MRKILLSEFITLDGVMEAPEKWVFAYHNEKTEKFKIDEMREVDTLLLGKVTYQGFSETWPSRTGVLADMMNRAKKNVVSKSLQELTWNNSYQIREDIIEEVQKLKQQEGKDILLVGSCLLAQTLMQHNLIDEYRLMIFPLMLGKGKRLFAMEDQLKLILTEVKTFDTGIVLLRYEPEKKD